MPSNEFVGPDDDERNTPDGEPLGSDGPPAWDEPESPEPQSPSPADEPVAGSSAWRRMVRHKAFVPAVVAVGALAASGVALLATRSLGPSQQLLKAVASRAPELTAGVADNVTGLTRNSPVAHTVQEYFRQQHYGPHGSLVKLVKVPSYPRGVSR
jgi:hypothetical protein